MDDKNLINPSNLPLEMRKMLVKEKVNNMIVAIMRDYDVRIKQIATQLGLPLKGDETQEGFYKLAAQHQLVCLHYTFDDQPKMNGYYFYKAKKLSAILYDPQIDSHGNLVIRKGKVQQDLGELKSKPSAITGNAASPEIVDMTDEKAEAPILTDKEGVIAGLN